MKFYVKFEDYIDSVVGPTYGPYDYVQITYGELKAYKDYMEYILAGQGYDQEWLLVDQEAERTKFTDFIVYTE